MNEKRRYRKIVYAVGIILFLSENGMCFSAFAAEILTHTGSIVTGDKEPEYPSEEIEYEGKTYRLVSAVLHDAAEKGILTYVTNSISYQLEGMQEPPEKAMMTLVDEQSGEEYNREVKRMDMTEQDSIWNDDFSFSITVAGYDADVFFLGDLEIPADADLSSYGTDFLSYLGLPEDCYRVDQVTWNGESYEQDGFLCRDAVATGEKLIRTVEVTYGGQVRTPDIKGKQYISVYEEVIPKSEEIIVTESNSQTVQEDRNSLSKQEKPKLFQKITQWIREHLTVVTIRAIFFIGICGSLLILWLKNRKDKKRQ